MVFYKEKKQNLCGFLFFFNSNLSSTRKISSYKNILIILLLLSQYFSQKNCIIYFLNFDFYSIFQYSCGQRSYSFYMIITLTSNELNVVKRSKFRFFCSIFSGIWIWYLWNFSYDAFDMITYRGYALVIIWFRAQYEQYFMSFSFFADKFRKP